MDAYLIKNTCMTDIIKNLFNLWIPSPIQELDWKEAKEKGLRIFAKRDDLIHHHISGNKYRKLKYNFIEFSKGNYDEVIAFGGAFSNLLHTLSYIGKAGKIKMKFYIRGDGYDQNNPSLADMHRNGVEMEFVDRQKFRKLRQKYFLTENAEKNKFIVPEGGSNHLALPGASELIQEIQDQLGKTPDYLVMDMGTGGTISGVISLLPDNCHLIAIPVLKGIDWTTTIENLSGLSDNQQKMRKVSINEDYHFGGFAKYNDELIQFMNDFHFNFGIPLDPIYTCKLVYGLNDLILKDFFKANSDIVWVHGGGIQGIRGFNYLHGNKIQY